MTPEADGYWTYNEWERHAVDKIANIAFHWPIDDKDREDYLRVQVESMIRKALRHGRSGRGNNDPVEP